MIVESIDQPVVATTWEGKENGFAKGELVLPKVKSNQSYCYPYWSLEVKFFSHGANTYHQTRIL